MKKLLFILSVLFFGKLQAQLSYHSLFLVFDDTEGVINVEKQNIKEHHFTRTIYNYKYHKDIIEINAKNEIDSEYFYYTFCKKDVWSVDLYHHKKPANSADNIIIFLPKIIYEYYERLDNIKTITEMEKIWETLTHQSFSLFFKNYMYIFKPFDNEPWGIRYNVFMIFKSDLEKDYIPCYEVRVNTVDIASHIDAVYIKKTD